VGIQLTHSPAEGDVAAADGLTDLTRHAARLSWSKIPPDLRAHAVRVFADTVGVMIAGGLRTEMMALAREDGPLFDAGSGRATILVPGLPHAGAAHAAFMNGTAGTFLELDEACPPASHPAIHVLPATLAAAQALHRSGPELMTAFVAGYEVVARLFDAYRLPYPVHPHGHLGAVGAAVAVAMLRRADAVEPALIAASLPILATWDPCLEGATVRNTWAGVAAEFGIRANLLASAGFTGSRTSHVTAFGHLVGSLVEPEALRRPIDPAALRIRDNYFKFHSACAGTHPPLDATIALGRIDPDDVGSVLVETSPRNWKLNGQSRGNDLSNRFSIPYAVAAAIVHGHTGPSAFVTDPRVTSLAARVHVRAADDLDSPEPPVRMPARVTVFLTDRTATHTVDYPYGHSANPASPARLRAKFEDIVAIPRASGLYDQLLDIDKVDDVAGLFAIIE
jgi:2-methylcitrate dehydratase PrpD